jgi:hypothetical protein
MTAELGQERPFPGDDFILQHSTRSAGLELRTEGRLAVTIVDLLPRMAFSIDEIKHRIAFERRSEPFRARSGWNGVCRGLLAGSGIEPLD